MKLVAAFRKTRKHLPVYLISLLLSFACYGADEREARLKAAFILNFAKFIDWPPSQLSQDANEIFFCFVGIDRYRNAYLETFDQKKVKGRNAVVKIIRYDEPIDDCSVLFVKDLNQGQIAHLQSVVSSSAILTIGESEAFMGAGGMIRFYAHQGKIRFEINPDAASRSGLTISSKLLNLAKIRADKNGDSP